MKVEYDLRSAAVTYEQEKQLGEDPVRLDFLIIKKDATVSLDDPIGQFFKMVNLFEYKSPEDGMSVDDFYKAQGYGLIYKGFDRKVNELPIEDMTLAGTYAKGGEIFVLYMGSPMKYRYLARNLIRLSGYKSDVDIKIVYSGLRPGEKLYEEKLMAEEGLKKK